MTNWDDMKFETFGAIVAYKRKRCGCTLRDLSRLTGISNPYLSQIENGKSNNPSCWKVLRLCEVLSIPTEILSVSMFEG
jgi:transcriptional regulator with XRE-family HTH domain